MGIKQNSGALLAPQLLKLPNTGRAPAGMHTTAGTHKTNTTRTSRIKSSTQLSSRSTKAQQKYAHALAILDRTASLGRQGLPVKTGCQVGGQAVGGMVTVVLQGCPAASSAAAAAAAAVHMLSQQGATAAHKASSHIDLQTAAAREGQERGTISAKPTLSDWHPAAGSRLSRQARHTQPQLMLHRHHLAA